MHPNNNFIIKEEDQSQKPSSNKDHEMKHHQMQLPQFYPSIHQFQMDPFPDNQMKKQQTQQPLGHESQPYMNVNFDEGSQKGHLVYEDPINPYLMDGYYDQNFMLRKPWFGNYCDDFYYMRVKREEGDDHRFWQAQIKDEEEISLINEHHNYEVKQEEMPMNKFHHEDLNKYIGSYDVNKYIGSSISKKEDKKNYRKMKVQRFLEKKKLRSFQKKITYHCRKEVAENRTRYKGRFISLKQGLSILGISPDETYEPEEIKRMLQKLELQENKQMKSELKKEEENVGQEIAKQQRLEK